MNRLQVAAIFLLAMVLGGCGSRPDAQVVEKGADEASKSIELTAEAQKIAGIEVAPAAMHMMQEEISVPGVIASTSTNRAVVTPPVAGRLIRLNVQPGDSVRQGRAVAVIESSELAQAWQAVAESERSRDAASSDVNQARSEASLAQAKVQSSLTSLARQKALAEAGAFSQAGLHQAQSELNDAQSDLLEAQSQLAFHSQQLQRSERLFKEGLVSKAELEAARLDVLLDKNRIDKEKGRVELAKSAYEREKNIAQKGLLNAREVQSAEADVRASRLEREKASIRLQATRAALTNAEQAVQNARATYRAFGGGGGSSGGSVSILAPLSGTVTSLEVTRGQAVDRTQTLMVIENLSSLWATANVQEKDGSKISRGAKVSVIAGSLEGRSFEGVVQILGSRLDSKTRTLPVQCLVSGSNGGLKPGMFVTVSIALKGPSLQLAVPMTAVVKDDGKSVVFVKSGDAFERREVSVGTASSGYVAILDGLKSGEQVAVKGNFVLTSESKKDELKGEE